MTSTAPSSGSASETARVGVIGTGVIGASWAALFAAAGMTVRASDPGPGEWP